LGQDNNNVWDRKAIFFFGVAQLHLRPLRNILDKLDLGLAHRLGARAVSRAEEGREHVARCFVVCKTLLPRGVLCQKRLITMSKETYYSGKREPFSVTCLAESVSKETHYTISESKETYYSVTWLTECVRRALRPIA
jgi:hypothetical protein